MERSNPSYEHLTAGQRGRIKRDFAEGKTTGQLSRKYGVTKRTIQKIVNPDNLIRLGGVAVAAFAVIGLSPGTPEASAVPPGPNTCVSGGGGFIGYGAYRDCDLWPDGSFWHEVTGGGPFAFGGSAGRVCDSPRGNPLPPATDNDPTTICPGW